MDKYLIRKLAVCLAGSFIYAAGITVVKVCNLGISPITSAPYAFSFVVGQTLGTCTMYLNAILYIIQKLVLKKEYTLRRFLTQFILSAVFAVLIDLTGSYIWCLAVLCWQWGSAAWSCLILACFPEKAWLFVYSGLQNWILGYARLCLTVPWLPWHWSSPLSF